MDEKEKLDAALKQQIVNQPSPTTTLKIIFGLAVHGTTKAFMLEQKKHLTGDQSYELDIRAGEILGIIQKAVALAEEKNPQVIEEEIAGLNFRRPSRN